MPVKDGYSRARATKKSSSVELNTNISKRNQKKAVNAIKKSPILIVAVLFLIIGIAGGFFAYKMLSSFEMNTYLVNGVASSEKDYVVVDVSAIKESVLSTDAEATMEEIFSSISLEDNSVTCKFFGIDISDSVSTKYYYREDISHDTQEVTKIDVTTAGVYYIEYTSSFFAFKNKTLIRTIVITEVENDG